MACLKRIHIIKWMWKKKGRNQVRDTVKNISQCPFPNMSAPWRCTQWKYTLWHLRVTAAAHSHQYSCEYEMADMKPWTRCGKRYMELGVFQCQDGSFRQQAKFRAILCIVHTIFIRNGCAVQSITVSLYF